MNMKLTDPKLYLTFEADDLEEGHSTSQTIASDYIVNRSFSGRFQKFNQLKSSSDQISLQIKRKCPSTEDIVATDGNVRAVLKDGEETIYSGYISTTFKWTVTNHGEKALSITIEGVGTRLLNQPFIETGKHYFDCAASAAVYDIVHPLGITIHAGDERKILQSVSRQAEAGDTCRDLLDSLFYECNAVYWFNNLGELCVDKIDPSTVGAETVDSSDLYVVNGEAVSLSKSIRAYKGARITYKALGTSQGYLVYRNTTNATATRICELTLPAGYYFDGAEIYSAAEWAAATADTFREPTLISAVNAASESSIVGSGAIVNISNLSPNVVAPSGVTVTFEAAGGPYFKLTCHNTTGSSQTITRLDLSADIIFEKSNGVIRTQIDGSTAGKSLLEEDLVWIHDKDNAQAHANMVSQYFQYAGATYTFRTKLDISTGTVIKLNEDLYSGLEVYVMIIAREFSAGSEIWKYTAVGISTFDLTESAYHGTTEPAKQSGAQGPAGEPGKGAEVQYAIGTSLTDPPGDAMMWGGADMLWASATMNWNTGTWEEDVPEEQRGKYIWMRTRIGDAPWQYTRLTGSASYDPTFLGAVNYLPTQTPDGLDLIPGDYFVAAEDFGAYSEGFAYVYNGSTWDVMDLEDVDNAPKALQCLGGILASGAHVTNATYSIWGWFQNFVAQNAVISNLFSQALTILSNGYLQSENYTPSTDDDVSEITDSEFSNGGITASLDKTRFVNEVGSYGVYKFVCVASGAYGGNWQLYKDNVAQTTLPYSDMVDDYGVSASYDFPDIASTVDDYIEVTFQHITVTGEGFYLGADGSFDCTNANATNMTIRGDSLFQGKFDCDVIKTVSVDPTVTGTYSASSGNGQAKTLLTAFPADVIPSYPSVDMTEYWSDYLQVQMTTPLGNSSDIVYVRLGRRKFQSDYYDDIAIYNASRNQLDIKNYFNVSDPSSSVKILWSRTRNGSVANGFYATSTVTIQTITGGNVLEVDIPPQSQASNLSSGQLYYDTSGYVRIKL